MSQDRTHKPASRALLALGAAAAALPGYSGSAQAWSDTQSEAGYRYSFYRESDLPGSSTNGLDGERYEVQTHKFHLLMPASETWDFNADVMLETMSGASPWYIVPGNNGEPIQIMSGATIDEQRAALNGRARRYHENGHHAASVGVSKEDDYQSVSGGVETAREFNRRQNTFSAGIGYSYDELDPTDGGSAAFPDRVRSADKDVTTVYAGLSQLFGPRTVGQLSLSYSYADGYLSDPYKQVYVDGNIIPDHRPGHRNSVAVSARLRHYLERVRAAVHVDARYFADDWGVQSDTLQLAWVQRLPADWRLTPSLRWYQQGRADFYRPYFTVTRQDGHYSSDHRLSAFGALSARLSMEKAWGAFSFALAGEVYDSEGGYALRDVNHESPSLVDFTVLSLAFAYRWGGVSAAVGAGNAASPDPIRVVPVAP